jgi:monovalent cation/hydrogen antiporter
MLIFEWTLFLLVAAVGLAALARRWRMPYPSLLALLGTLLVFMPGTPRVALEPELALALFVAPVLLDAAFDTSPRELRGHWRAVSALVIVAVGLTIVCVAVTARALVPSLPWAAAIALGAVVAPPDAAAATAILKETRPPHRLMQVLQGESLLNDASALLTYRLAVAAAVGAGVSPSQALPLLAVVIVGSLVAGVGLGTLVGRVLPRVNDVPTSIVLQFASTFGVWLLAERVGLSGILTVVAYAMALARISPHTTPARVRVPSYAVWETVIFVLNALAFVLIGLQLGPILGRLDAAERGVYGSVALAALGVTVLVRIVWVMGFEWALMLFGRRSPGARAARLSVPGALVVSWCGMRGVVTLAAALALPGGEQPFPGRDLILITAFTVVLGTLVLQGLTLRPLLLWLDLHDNDPVERDAGVARRTALKAALHSFDGDTSPAAQALRAEYRQLWPQFADGAEADTSDGVSQLRARSIVAAREALARLRKEGQVGDDAFHRVELELDRAELYAEASDPRSPTS